MSKNISQEEFDKLLAGGKSVTDVIASLKNPKRCKRCSESFNTVTNNHVDKVRDGWCPECVEDTTCSDCGEILAGHEEGSCDECLDAYEAEQEES